MALTAKQQAFIREFLVDMNATQAALRAGYSEASAKEIGYQNLGKPAIADAIAAAIQARAARTDASADRVVEELTKLAYADITDAVDWGDAVAVMPEGGGDPIAVQGIVLVPAKDLPKHVRAAIAEVAQTKDGLKIKMHNKTSALDMLAKHLGLYAPERKEVTGRNGGPIETKDLTPHERARKVAALVAEMQAQEKT